MLHETPSRTIHLLWTGGWDSTFRLLSALRLEGAEVRPHYVLDPSSPCSELEIDAMQRVREALQRHSPALAERLLPMSSASLDDLPEDDAETERYARLSARSGIGRHYEWLGRYARHAGLDEIEVGCHRDDPAMSLLNGCLRRVGERPFATYRLADEARETDLGLFSRLTFPLAELARADMRRFALDGGFLEQLEHTWFCLTPRRGSACGVCAKCHEAVVDGMGHRLPPVSRRLHDVKWHTRWKPWQHVIDRVVG